MIVQCEGCRTKFNLDETLVQKEGSKVRCSRCGNIFLVYCPEPVGDAKEEIAFASQDETPSMEASKDEPDSGLNFSELLEEDSMEEISNLETQYQEDPEGFAEEGTVISEEAEEETISAQETGEKSAQAAPDKKESNKKKKIVIVCIVLLVLVGSIFVLDKLVPKMFTGLFTSVNGPSEESKTVDTGASRLEIMTVEGSFYNSEKAGRLFVISGKVGNNYPQSRSAILVKGCILDNKGQVVKEKTAFAGNVFKKEEFNTLSSEEINQAMENGPGSEKQDVLIQPGTSIDFMIVFEKLPDNLSEFTVSVVSSSPGSSKAGGQP